jgi:hypothetical protein
MDTKSLDQYGTRLVEKRRGPAAKESEYHLTSPDGKRTLLVRDGIAGFVVLDASTNEELLRILNFRPVAFSPDGKRLEVEGGGRGKQVLQAADW